MPARSPKTPAEEVVHSLLALEVPAAAVSEQLVETDGREIAVVTRRSVSETEAEGLARQLAGGIIVADRISAGARLALAKGRVAWLDRRGHLQLRGATLRIDADVPPLVEPEPTRVTDLFAPTGLDVGIALLLDPERPRGTMEVAAKIERSPGRVSEILAAMRDKGLVDRENRPAVPDLFDEMAEIWAPAWRPIGTLPPEPDADIHRLSGTLGAIWHGAPVVAAVDWPPDLYVRDRSELRAVLRAHGALPGSPIAGRVAVCPSRYGWSKLPEHLNSDFPVANLVVVALDLAQDRGRGREVLESWEPEGHTRVW